LRHVQIARSRTECDEMLALTRKAGQSIVIGGLDGTIPLVTVTILEIREDRIRLGFTASRKIPIHRKEVWIRLQPPGNTALDEGKAVASGSVSL